MKIWILTNDYKPTYGYGISSYIDQAIRMYTPKHQVSIFTPDSYQSSIESLENNVCIVRYFDKSLTNNEFINMYLGMSHQAAEEILLHIDQNGAPDSIEVQDCMALGYYLLLRKQQGEARLKNTSIVLVAHTPRFLLITANQENQFSHDNYLISMHEKECYRMADAVLCPSKFLADQLREYLPEITITIVPLPFELCQETTCPQDIAQDILFVGRLEPRKGILAALEIIEDMWKKEQPLRVTLIGANYYLEPYACSAIEYISKKYHQAIIQGYLKIIQQLPPALVYEQMRRSRFVLIPSTFDNFPITCLEAMALGTPVIAATSGGQAELINEQTGFIFSWETPADFAKVLDSALQSPQKTLQQKTTAAKELLQAYCGYTNVLTQREKILTAIHKRSFSPYSPKRFAQEQFAKIIPPISEEKLSLELYGVLEKKKGTLLNYTSGKTSERQSIPQLLSIIVITTNPTKTLINRLQQINTTQYGKKELLLIDAGTWLPESNKLLESLLKQKNIPLRFFRIHESNTSKACNCGARLAQGEFITFIRDTEMVSADFYSKAIQQLQQNTAYSFCYSWVAITGLYEQILPMFFPELPYLLYNNVVSPIAVYRRDIYLSFGQKPETYNDGTEDHLSTLHLLQAGHTGQVLLEVLSFIVITNESQAYHPQTLQSVYKELPELIQKYGIETLRLVKANTPCDLTLK